MAYIEQKSAIAARQNSISSLEEQLELSFSVRNIPKYDLLSPSDPFIVIYIKSEINNTYSRKATTEIVWDNPNADFSKEIRIPYRFEEVQTVKLEVYDADTKNTNNLKQHDFIGVCEFIVGDLVTANGQKLTLPIKNRQGKLLKKVKKLQPLLIVRSSEIDDNYDELELEIHGKSLPKMDWFGKVDPFFQIYRKGNDGGWVSVYKSEFIKREYHPKWKRFSIQMRRLCHGDEKRPILFKIFDWNRDAKPDYVGEFETDVGSLLQTEKIKLIKRNPKTGKLARKSKGKILVKHIKLIKKYSFLQFLRGGMEIQLMVAIDFTGSNGNPTERNSLHYMGPPTFESQYLQVIKTVGRVLEPYDSDGNIAAYGFGANLNPMYKNVSHCFPLTFDESNVEVDGIEGLIDAYKKTLNRVQLYGPTYFSEIISTAYASTIDQCSNKSQCYTILLIITDGVINDMKKTIDRIVEATSHPLSIIIVGVGNANFDNMDVLDADEIPLRHSNGAMMKRDIVQFVAFNEFKNKPLSMLAKETLEEVPRQVQNFMAQNNIKPMKAKLAKGNSIDNVFMKGVNLQESKNNNDDDFKGNNNNDNNKSYFNKQKKDEYSEGDVNATKYNKNNFNQNISQNKSGPYNPYYGGNQ